MFADPPRSGTPPRDRLPADPYTVARQIERARSTYRARYGPAKALYSATKDKSQSHEPSRPDRDP